ncbi:VOC family protein [Fulvivirga ligni]|uniref:VOC family protein n=1 Tax=Fulvivirga ligni TaxID=2904246 RepID=UPI001F323303|nr:VOC family protein [Fulvivirga ligni]UII21009.1 VOC family protein [Fulvivirga ligni]
MQSIELLSVPVTDQQRAKEFYLKMGLELVTEAPFQNDQLWIQLKFPNGGPDITLVNWFEKMPAGSLQAVVIKTDDIVSDVEALNGKGIETGTIDDTPWGKFASVKDPDGNSWSLHQG